MTSILEDFREFPKVRLLPELRRTGAGNYWEVAHRHQQLEFNLVMAGKGAYFLRHGHYELVPGTLVWLLPDQPHRLIRNADLDMWVSALEPEHFTADMLAQATQTPVTRLSTEALTALDRLFAHISQDADAPGVHAAGLIYAAHSALHAARTTSGPPPQALHPAVTRGLACLRSEAEVRNLAALARRCGVSANYLGELLVEQTGRGFVEWRNIVRLERFQIAYPQSGDLLTAALAAGFGSYTQFHRVFLDIVGTTPGDWARNQSEGARINLPQMGSARDPAIAGNSPLLWCALVGTRISVVDGWFSAIRARSAHLLADVAADGPPVPSGVDDILCLRPYQAKIIDALCEAAPELAERIRETLQVTDLLDRYCATLMGYGDFHRDLAELSALALTMHCMAANRLPIPTREEFDRIARIMRQAAVRAPPASGIEARRELTMGLITLAMLWRNAAAGVVGSGQETTAIRVAEAACAASIDMLGFDIRQNPLYGPRSVFLSAA